MGNINYKLAIKLVLCHLFKCVEVIGFGGVTNGQPKIVVNDVAAASVLRTIKAMCDQYEM